MILRHSMQAGVGHIGSALSVADILASLYGDILSGTGLDDPDRDRFILSKGHAALALYCALAACDYLSDEQLTTYCQDGGQLGVHPDCRLSEVDFSTGSLGHGLSIGVGAALAARMQGSSRRVFVLTSDAEHNEGSLWEAVMFAGHHRLSNLVSLVDFNNQQAMGASHSILNLDPLVDKYEAFGWKSHLVDGHDQAALSGLLDSLDYESGAPHALIARTTFGKGVSFMENRLSWHYYPMNDMQYQLAIKDLELMEPG